MTPSVTLNASQHKLPPCMTRLSYFFNTMCLLHILLLWNQPLLGIFTGYEYFWNILNDVTLLFKIWRHHIFQLFFRAVLFAVTNRDYHRFPVLRNYSSTTYKKVNFARPIINGKIAGQLVKWFVWICNRLPRFMFNVMMNCLTDWKSLTTLQL